MLIATVISGGTDFYLIIHIPDDWVPSLCNCCDRLAAVPELTLGLDTHQLHYGLTAHIPARAYAHAPEISELLDPCFKSSDEVAAIGRGARDPQESYALLPWATFDEWSAAVALTSSYNADYHVFAATEHKVLNPDRTLYLNVYQGYDDSERTSIDLDIDLTEALQHVEKVRAGDTTPRPATT